MSDIDILVLFLPADTRAAMVISDGLSDRIIRHRFRFVAVGPNEASWAEIGKLARSCPCILFCWSSSTSASNAGELRALGVQALKRRHALSVELDRHSLPPEMATCTTYPLYGWRTNRGLLGRLLHGHAYVTEIVAAAEQKVIGFDPPPPTAYLRLVRRQAWITMGAIAFALSILSSIAGLNSESTVQKWWYWRTGTIFDAARVSRDCAKMRRFSNQYSGSPWSGEASELLATCHLEPKVQHITVTQVFPYFASNEPEAQKRAHQLCSDFARNTQATLKSTSVDITAPSGDMSGVARCQLDQPMTAFIEVMGR